MRDLSWIPEIIAFRMWCKSISIHEEYLRAAFRTRQTDGSTRSTRHVHYIHAIGFVDFNPESTASFG
ncbi:hypothetical protein KL86PLE_90332 [uncultured Pleomorphomonas sp.]|uniref:Uncharacterized protein n=1 Tax=uncultured Pleomorphomonas sp. TaxID=442121 RepID=A0A212LPD3_9HYPH|nr:hypothetical protein KL86PLE_90332 [uncultured Pleomorphomonas sp.]